ncbi:hypothetical protein ACOQFV_18480, partial [Nocardiopsis changdeensis]|uniref:hypothetical protein n=1 Tax=Nocardiopsis changdeensis TaxID=2831969 RepID=UPI003B9920A9
MGPHFGTDGLTPDVALSELRSRFRKALHQKNWNQDTLADRAGLSRAVVNPVVSTTNNEKVPSERTVRRLAEALKLEEGPLLTLLAAAVAAPAQPQSGLGRPIRAWDPHDLEMRVAGNPPDSPTATVGVPQRDTARLPGYVRRDHDDELGRAMQAAVDGASRMVVLVGYSSTGKTRACWEAIQPLAERGWRLWHPLNPTRAEALLADIENVGPHTVLWLNETQHYLGHPRFGERVASALHTLLTSPDRAPVLVLGTLWKEPAQTFTALPQPGQADEHATARALLEGRLVPVPVDFTHAQLDDVRKLAEAGDGQLAHALEHVRDRRLTQTLAGAPDLVLRYQHGSRPAQALLEAAMDARLLGVGFHLPLNFLAEAAEDYLTDDEIDALDDQWMEAGLRETRLPVHGGWAPLRRIRFRRRDQNPTEPQGPVYRLEEYLEQHARDTRWEKCPPASFWEAAHRHLTDPDDLYVLAQAARRRGLLRHSVRLSHRAILAHHPQAAHLAAELLSPDTDPQQQGADWIAAHANVTDPHGVGFLLKRLRDIGPEQTVEVLASRVITYADLTDPSGIAHLLGELRRVGQEQALEVLASRAASHTDPTDPSGVAFLLEELRRVGQEQALEVLASRAASHTDPTSPSGVAFLLEELRRAGQEQALEVLASRAASHADPANPHSILPLLGELRRAGQEQALEVLASRAASHADPANPHSILPLLMKLGRTGQRQALEVLASRAASHTGLTDSSGIAHLLGELRAAGQEQAVAALLARNPAAHADLTDPSGVAFLLEELRRVGQEQALEVLASRAASHTDLTSPSGVAFLLEELRRVGQEQALEVLASRAASHTDPTSPSGVAFLLEELRRAGQEQA